MVSAFFGLNDDPNVLGEYSINTVLEPTFLLMYWMGFSFSEAMNLPLGWRRWFIDRVQKELSKTGPNGEGPPSKGAAQNTADTRSLMGMARDQVPARLRRFT